jgi:PAS domain S-box-containing protein
MTLFRDLPIKRKLMAITMLTSCLAMLLTCIAFLLYVQLSYRKHLAGELATTAGIIGDNCAAALAFQDQDAANEVLQSLVHQESITAAAVYGETGIPFAIYRNGASHQPFIPPPVESETHRLNGDNAEMFHDITLYGDTIGTIYLRHDMRGLYTLRRNYAIIAIGVIIGASLVSWFVSSRLQRTISGPLGTLTGVVAQVAEEKDYSLRAVKQGRDELGQLIDGFNGMLDQIQRRDLALKSAQDDLEVRVKQRTVELADSLSVLGATLESTTDGILARHFDKRIDIYNSRFLSMWNIPPGMMERPDSGIIDFTAKMVQDPDAFKARIMEIHSNPEEEAFDILHLVDGRIFERFCKPQRINGKSVGFVVNFRDVTERRRAEEELRWKTAFLEAQADSSLDGILVVDSEGRHIQNNRKFIEMWNLPQHILDNKDDAAHLDYVSSQLKDPEVFQERVEYLYANPSEIGRDEIEMADGRSFDRYSAPVTGKDGTFYGRIWTFRDITERKQAAQALAELSRRTAHRERILTTMLSSISDFAFIFDRQIRFVFANQPLLNLLGRSLEDIVGKTFFELDYPEELAIKLTHQIREIFKTGRVVVDETPFTSPGGVPGSYEYIFSPAFAEDRSVEFVVGCTRDITEHKQSQAALRASEAEFRVLVEALPQIIWITRPDGQCTHCNQRWIEYTGMTQEESLGYGWQAPFHPDDKEIAARRWKHASTTGETYEIEHRLRRADGSYRWMLSRAMPLWDIEGQIVKWFGTCTDIHDLKAAELEISRANRELRESDERFQQLADNISDVFWISSPDFNTMHYISAGYERIWGRSVESLYANPHQRAEVIVPEERDQVTAAFARMASTPEVTAEYRIVRPDGSIRWIHDRGFQVRDAGGRLVRLAGIASDITERKRAEAELKRKHSELVHASRQAGMSEVATSVLHNVGNVLNSVNISCSLIAEMARNSRIGSVAKTAELLRNNESRLVEFLTSDPTGSRLPQFLTKLAARLLEEQAATQAELKLLVGNIEHIKEIVAVQLDYARNFGNVRESLPLESLMEDALRMNEGALTLGNISVTREYLEMPPVPMEKHKVLQILVNLIRNASHALGDSGRSDLRLILRTGIRDGVATASIIDNGIGIAPENLTRIFAHGFTTKPDGNGFGLHSGVLAAQEMGGSLIVHSDGLGQGATFTLELPLASAPTS